MVTSNSLRFCLTDGGYIIRVIGKGTLAQSPAVRAFTMRCVRDEGTTVTLDLSRCGYLDSTFLGCLVGLNQNCCPDHNLRFQVYVPAEDRGRLFGLTQIDKILNLVERLPEPRHEFLDLDAEQLETCDLGQHIMEAHRRLAELGGPDAESYRSVADLIADDLRKRRGEGPD